MGNKLPSFSLKDIGDLFCSCKCASHYSGKGNSLKLNEKELDDMISISSPLTVKKLKKTDQHIWVPITDDEKLPDKAVKGGYDRNKNITYVARENPGDNKLKNICEYNPENDLIDDDIEVLVGDNYKWVTQQKGESVPKGTIVEGDYYFGLVNHKGKAKIIGQVDDDKKQVHYHWKGKTIKSKKYDYEVLVHKRK